MPLFRSLDLSPWFAISISWSYFSWQCHQPPPLTFHLDQYHCWSSLPLFSVSQSHHTVFTTGCDKCSNSTAYSTLCTLPVFLHSYDSGTSNFQPIWMAGSLSTSRSLRLTDFNHINVPCTGRLLCGFLRGHLRMAGSFFTHNWQRLTYVDFVDFSPWTRGLICSGLPSHFVLCCHFSLSHRRNPYLCCYIACHSFLWGNLPLIVCWPLRLQCNSYWPGDHNHRSWGRDDLITFQSPQFLNGHMLHRYPHDDVSGRALVVYGAGLPHDGNTSKSVCCAHRWCAGIAVNGRPTLCHTEGTPAQASSSSETMTRIGKYMSTLHIHHDILFFVCWGHIVITEMKGQTALLRWTTRKLPGKNAMENSSTHFVK